MDSIVDFLTIAVRWDFKAWLHQEGVVQSETETEEGHQLTVRWTARQEKRFRDL